MRVGVLRQPTVWIAGVLFAGVAGVAALVFAGEPDTAPGNAAAASAKATDTADAPIKFNRDIAPLLSENCFACHGPDKNKRKADLRLDTKAGLFGKLENGTPVVAGHPEQSEIISRITSDDPDERMPPPKSKKPKLTAGQVELLKRWIQQGAPWEGHWSFTPPQRPAVPLVKDAASVRNPIDAFILQRLEKENLHPSKEADKVTLIRRLTLDLTGLPPTPKDVDEFVADARPDAYKRLVDRLFASPHFGERLALDWLDVARFADTHGYHIDSGRDQTRWREWVIDTFNRNQPFDQFTIEQLAGDLLPSPTTDQRIATGFVRNNMVNFEGGAIPEEYRTAYVLDRVNTAGTVWLGLTVGCTQCHDHKFDPITQKEFYQLFAFFNNVPENGLDGRKGNAVPVLKAPTPDQQKKLDELAAATKHIEQQLAGPMPEVDEAQAAWEQSTAARTKAAWALLEPSEMKSAGGAALMAQADKTILVSGPNPAQDTYTIVAPTDLPEVTGLKLETLTDANFAGKGPGRSDNGNIVLTAVRLALAAPADADGHADAGASNAAAAKFRAASADFSQKDFPVASAIDGNSSTGWAIYPEVGKQHEAIFELEKPLRTEAAGRVAVTLEFKSPFGQHQLGKFRLAVTGSPKPATPSKLPANVVKALAAPADERTSAQKTELRDHFRKNVSTEARKLADELAKLKKRRDDLDAAVPSTMVMEEMAKPRDTFILMRGQYDKPGDKVMPGTPAFLPPLAKDVKPDRLALARWLVDRGNPLTARVAVNRYWQMLFGTGIVKTAEDFGTQGEPPSHPELLDWLAVEFMDPSTGSTGSPQAGSGQGGWDVRHMLRLMVTSAAYRQSSAMTPELVAKDPENRLLARGPRFRLPAEFIRDQALAVSGLLDDRIGGASVSPYQPPGLWEELMSRADGANWTAQTYTQSHGRDLYRRTMYTFWKRTSPPPTLATFDAPDRETCTVRRARTNTPLQALVLMNDPTYIEASRKLAERMMKEAGAAPEERIAFAFRLVTAREPRPEETAVLKAVFDKQAERYAKDHAAAAKKLLGIGEAPRDDKLDPAELAAWTNVASVLLNLDEAVTKG